MTLAKLRSSAPFALVAALCAVLLSLFAVGCGSQAQPTSTSSSEPVASTPAEVEDEAETEETGQGVAASPSSSASAASDDPYANGIHHATIEVADYGTITVELNATIAPITVANFAALANDGFYDGLTFHRIMQGFMIQGGDPSGDGTGGSDENIVGEFEQNGHFNPISHTRGTISMARSNDYNSASSQFFICDADSTFLDGSYAAFGHVTEGMDVVDAIAADAEPIDDNGTIPAEQQPVITAIEIVD